MTLNPFSRKDMPLARLAECPSCQCDVAVEVQGPRGPMLATRQAGERVEAVGVAADCARCGSRFVRLYAGGTLAYGRNRVGAGQNLAVARAGTDRVAGMPGGEGTEGGGSLFGDMVTNLDDPRF